jgi:toxin YoeB
MRDYLFSTLAFEQYNEWQKDKKQVIERLKKLITETARTPFDGTGKPEALRHDYAGCWS